MPIDFDAEVARLRDKKRIIRRKRWGRSRLDRYKPELIELRKRGASLAELALWLAERRVRVHRSTVQRWLASRMPKESE